MVGQDDFKEFLNKLDIIKKEHFFNSVLENKDFNDFLIRNNRRISLIKKEKNPYHSRCKEIYINYVKEVKHIDHYWTGEDAKNLNQLINKIKKLFPENFEEEKLYKAFERFLYRIKSVDDFVYENYKLSIINSYFSILSSKMKNNPTKIRVMPVDGGNVISITKDEYEKNKHYYKKL